MLERNRLAEAEKQLGIVLEKIGDDPHSEELEAMKRRLSEIQREISS